MDAGWRDLEVPLHVGFRGRLAEDTAVGVDEGQVLTLLGGERASRDTRLWRAAASITPARSNEPRFCSPPTAVSVTTILPLLWHRRLIASDRNTRSLIQAPTVRLSLNFYTR